MGFFKVLFNCGFFCFSGGFVCLGFVSGVFFCLIWFCVFVLDFGVGCFGAEERSLLGAFFPP